MDNSVASLPAMSDNVFLLLFTIEPIHSKQHLNFCINKLLNNKPMVISDNLNYSTILKSIAKDIIDNMIEYFLQGREHIIMFWLNNINDSVNSLGEKSIVILIKDINHIIDKILGVDFE